MAELNAVKSIKIKKKMCLNHLPEYVANCLLIKLCSKVICIQKTCFYKKHTTKYFYENTKSRIYTLRLFANKLKNAYTSVTAYNFGIATRVT